MNKILFSFKELGTNDKALKAVIKEFKKNGLTPIDDGIEVSKSKITNGMRFKEVRVIFTDSQNITLRVNETGDIYQVLINKKLTPIKEQENHGKAIKEIAHLLDTGRSKFVAKMEKAKIAIPAKARTAQPNMLKALTEKRDNLLEAITAIKEEILKVKGVTA